MLGQLGANSLLLPHCPFSAVETPAHAQPMEASSLCSILAGTKGTVEFSAQSRMASDPSPRLSV